MNSNARPGQPSTDTTYSTELPAFATDGRNRVVYWNGAAEVLIGISAREAQGRLASSILGEKGFNERFQASVIRLPGAGGDTKVYVLQPAPRRAAWARADESVPACPLSSREREVLALLSEGYAALNIAARLDLSYATVRNHIQNALRKLKVHGQVEAVSISFRNGWIPSRSVPVNVPAFASAA